MKTQERSIRFSLGQVVATPGAIDALQRNSALAMQYVRRHAAGDWGTMCEEDQRANNQALETGARLMSSYTLPDETTLWIITDAADDKGQRAVTTLLLPDEY